MIATLLYTQPDIEFYHLAPQLAGHSFAAKFLGDFWACTADGAPAAEPLQLDLSPYEIRSLSLADRAGNHLAVLGMSEDFLEEFLPHARTGVYIDNDWLMAFPDASLLIVLQSSPGEMRVEVTSTPMLESTLHAAGPFQSRMMALLEKTTALLERR